MKNSKNIYFFTLMSIVVLMACQTKTNASSQKLQTTNLDQSVGCSFTLPLEVKIYQGASVKTKDSQIAIISSGSGITITGQKNTIVVGDGGAATIAGNYNIIYVSDKGAITVSGSNNQIIQTSVSGVTDVGEENSMKICDSIAIEMKGSFSNFNFTTKSASLTNDDSLEDKLSVANEIVTDVGSKISELELGDIAADENNNLVGKWKVVSAQVNKKNISAKGAIYLYANGTGIQNYAVRLAGVNIPQLGKFTWKTNANKMYVNSDELLNELIWNIKSSYNNAHQVTMMIEEVLVTLFLERK